MYTMNPICKRVMLHYYKYVGLLNYDKLCKIKNSNLN